MKRGRKLGRQAETTPIDGSAAVQRAGGTKLPGNVVRKAPLERIWPDDYMRYLLG